MMSTVPLSTMANHKGTEEWQKGPDGWLAGSSLTKYQRIYHKKFVREMFHTFNPSNKIAKKLETIRHMADTRLYKSFALSAIKVIISYGSINSSPSCQKH